MDGKSSSASWRKPITVGFVLQNNALWKVGSWVVMLLLLLEQSYLASTINNTHLQMCYTGIRLLVQKPLENRSPKQISALLWRFTNDSSRVTRHQRLRRVSSHHAIGYPCKVNPFRISRFVIWRRGKILNIVLAYCNWIHLIIQMYIYIHGIYDIPVCIYERIQSLSPNPLVNDIHVCSPWNQRNSLENAESAHLYLIGSGIQFNKMKSFPPWHCSDLDWDWPRVFGIGREPRMYVLYTTFLEYVGILHNCQSRDIFFLGMV